MTKTNGLGRKVASVKIFMMNGEIFGAYKRSSAKNHFENNSASYSGTYQCAVHSDIETAEKNIIDLENKYI